MKIRNGLKADLALSKYLSEEKTRRREMKKEK